MQLHGRAGQQPVDAGPHRIAIGKLTWSRIASYLAWSFSFTMKHSFRTSIELRVRSGVIALPGQRG